MEIEDKDLPGLYQSANSASLEEQKKYFNGISLYLTLLIIASLFSYFANDFQSPIFRIISTVLFLLTLFIIIWLRISRPDDIWYNGRAVAESVKTRSWRWMMRAEPYIDSEKVDMMRKHFVNDLITILKQNESLIRKLKISASVEEPISDKMLQVRKLDLRERFILYRKERITNQELWYIKKAEFNKTKAEFWFWSTVVIHSFIIIFLLYNIYVPALRPPVGVLAIAASSVLTWLQSKKHNELSSSYALAAHEIVLIKSETTRIETEMDFSNYIMNCENAFSREHTQWYARKSQ